MKKSIFYDQYVAHSSPKQQPPLLFRMFQKYELHRYDAMAQLLGKKKYTNILDIGCGDGSFLLKVQHKAKKITGVEIVPELAKKAAKQPFTTPSSFKVIKPENLKLPFPDKNFDLVVALATLQYVYDIDFMFSEVHRVLKRNGLYIFEVPNFLVFWRRFQLLFGIYPQTSLYTDGWNGGMLHSFSEKKLVEFTEKKGFVVEQVTCSGIFTNFRKLWPSLLGANLILVCRKKS